MERWILLQCLLILGASHGYGQILGMRHRLNQRLWIVLGFAGLLAFTQGLGYFWVLLRLRPDLYYGLILLLVGVGNLVAIVNIRKQRWSVCYLLGLIIVVALLTLSSARYDFGIETFDTAVYLTTVVDNLDAPFLNAFSPYTGNLVSTINVENDFQTFYYFNTAFLWLVQKFYAWQRPDVYPTLISIYFWSMSLVYYTLLYQLSMGLIQVLHLDRLLDRLLVFVGIFGFFASFYYTSIFAFYGNTYRVLLLAFISILVWLNLDDALDVRFTSLALALSGFAAISTSASSYFTVFMMLVVWLLVSSKRLDTQLWMRTALIISLPVVFFVLFFLTANHLSLWMISLGLTVFVGILLWIYAKHFGVLKRYFPWLLFGVMFMATVVRIFMKDDSFALFFVQGSRYDMVWDYFYIGSWTHLLVNGFIWLMLIGYGWKSVQHYKAYVLWLIIIFLNPWMFQGVLWFLPSNVFHRFWDALLNPFSLLLIYSSLSILKKQWIQITLLVGLLFMSWTSIQTVYTGRFIKDEGLNELERIPATLHEILDVLNTKIILEEYERAKVVSQFHMFKAYVPNTISVLSLQEYRRFDLYGKQLAPSELWNIFIYRYYDGMAVFDTAPDYTNTCQYLIDEQVDFVVVAKNQYHRVDGDYKHLYIYVRACGTLVYENEDYLLYQFYW